MQPLPPWLKVLYPFEGKEFSGNEGVQNYVDEGEGQAIVMLHGNPTWTFFYRELILDLRGSFRCLAMDHLGCGFSEKPDRADYSLSGHIGRTLDWIESLRLEKFHLVVHDWGGAIGFGVASRLRERISGITVFNTAAFRFPSIPFRIAVCRWPIVGKPLVMGANAFAKAATVMTTVTALSDAVREGYLFPYSDWSSRRAIYRFVADIPMRPTHPSWETLVQIEESLKFWKERPVQIIWGMRDWCFHGKILQEWEQRLPGAHVHRIPEAGHYLLEDACGEIHSLVREFVSETQA